MSIHLTLGGPDRTRTCDLRFRKPLLYPAELRDRPAFLVANRASRQSASRTSAIGGNQDKVCSRCVVRLLRTAGTTGLSTWQCGKSDAINLVFLRHLRHPR